MRSGNSRAQIFDELMEDSVRSWKRPLSPLGLSFSIYKMVVVG